MKKLIFLVLMTIFSISNLFANERYEPGVILLQLKNPDAVQLNQKKVINGSQKFQNTLDKHAIQNSKKLSHVSRETDGWYRLEFPVKSDLKMIRSDLTNCQDIRYAIFNNYGVLYSEPNDPHYLSGDQWALEKIQMPLGWDITKSDQTILVGILDSGMDYNHEDLSENVWTNPDEIPDDYIDNDNNGYVDDIIRMGFC